MAERGGSRDGANAPSTESTQKSSRPLYRLWTPGELERVAAHPEMTAAELSAMLPGRTAKAVRRIRERHGRRVAGSTPTCRACDARPVWEESPRARRMGLCKGCYLDEMERRAAEDARANALRKRFHDARRREARTKPEDSVGGAPQRDPRRPPAAP